MFECSCLLLQHHMHHTCITEITWWLICLYVTAASHIEIHRRETLQKETEFLLHFSGLLLVFDRFLLLYLKLHWNEFDAQVFSGCARRLATTSHCSCKQMTLSHSKAAGSLKFYLHVRFKQLYSTFIAIGNKMKKVKSTQWKNKHLSDWDPQLLIIYRHFLILSFLFV